MDSGGDDLREDTSALRGTCREGDSILRFLDDFLEFVIVLLDDGRELRGFLFRAFRVDFFWIEVHRVGPLNQDGLQVGDFLRAGVRCLGGEYLYELRECEPRILVVLEFLVRHASSVGPIRRWALSRSVSQI